MSFYATSSTWEELVQFEKALFDYVDLSEHPKFEELGLTGEVLIKHAAEGPRLERSIRDYILKVADLKEHFDQNAKNIELEAFIGGFNWVIIVKDLDRKLAHLIRIMAADRRIVTVDMKTGKLVSLVNPKSKEDIMGIYTEGRIDAGSDPKKLLDSIRDMKQRILYRIRTQQAGISTPTYAKPTPTKQIDITVDVSDLLGEESQEIQQETSYQQESHSTNESSLDGLL